MMIHPEHDFSGTRQDWELRVALAATDFSAVLIFNRRRLRAEFFSLDEVLAWRFREAPDKMPMVYAIAPERAPGATRRSVHLDAGLVGRLRAARRAA